jgi:tetratricopeptide (TPR) repeat protein/transcriptional regulator with XRE-family HTH domain
VLAERHFGAKAWEGALAEPGAFATLLRKLRIAAGLTQEELAEAARLSVRSVSDLERGVNQTARKQTARLLAEALRLSGPSREEFEAVARGHQPPTAADGIDDLSQSHIPGEAASVTRTLPRDISSFTGREEILAALIASASGGGIVGIHAIGGMAGVGKTTLAVHAAHLLSDAFADGQFFLPMHGHTPGRRPVDPAEALASLLLAAGVAAGRIPSALDDRAALWRDQLAGRRALLVLDDAASTEHVRPLLPGGNGTLVLITSRLHLTALDDAQVISLDVLWPDEAAELLVRLASRPALGPGDAGVLELARLCGYLPLAIGLIGRQLKHHPSWTVADVAAELASTRDSLALMRAENVSVSAAFNLSYEDLPADERRLFRRLGLHPDPEIGIEAAAALAGETVPVTSRWLAVIYDHYLLSEPARGRYRLHDLIRAHAVSLADRHDSEADRNEAVRRLFDYYKTATAGGRASLAWLRVERAGLLACIDHAAALGDLGTVTQLTAGIAPLLQHDGPWAEAISRHDRAARAARQTDDRPGEAGALLNLGLARQSTGAYQEAQDAYHAAFSLYRDLGNRQGLADTLSGLGGIRVRTGDYPGAASTLLAALDIFRELGNREGQGRVLVELGLVGYHSDAGPDAAAVLTEALGIYRELSDRRGASGVLNLLGMVHRKNGDYEAAVGCLTESLSIARDVGRPLGRLNALNNLGVTERLLGKPEAALKTLEEALGIAREIGNRQGEANALCFLGAARQETADYRGARDALNAALDLYLTLGDRGGEAEARNERATLDWITGDLAQAEAGHQAALEIALQIGSSWDEAFAHAGLGRCAIASGRADQGKASLKRAHDLYERADPGFARRIAAELAALGRSEPSSQTSI